MLVVTGSHSTSRASYTPGRFEVTEGASTTGAEVISPKEAKKLVGAKKARYEE